MKQTVKATTSSSCTEFAFVLFLSFVCFEIIEANPQRMILNTSNDGDNSFQTHQRGDFFQKVIVTTVLEEPYMMLKLHSPYLAGNDRFEGYLADILMKLAASAGFQYEIRLAKDGKQGQLNSKLQWDGMIGEVISGEADVAAGAIIVTDEMREYVDFTEPFLSFRSSALIRRPKSKRRPQRIETVDQLLASDLSYGVVDGSAAFRILSASNDERNRLMWRRIRESRSSRIVASVKEGVDRARRENYAFVVDSSKAEYEATRKPCDLYATEPFLDLMQYAFAMRKDDRRLRGAVDVELRRMVLSDEMQTMYLRWWRDECSETSSSSSSSSSSTKEDRGQHGELRRNTADSKATGAVVRGPAGAEGGRSSSGAGVCLTSNTALLILAIVVIRAIRGRLI